MNDRQKVVREALVDEAEYGDLEVRIHYDYSGRGMFGDGCLGLSGSFEDLWTLVMEAQTELVRQEGEDAPRAARIPAPRRDSMGRSDEIWYWPGIPGEEGR